MNGIAAEVAVEVHVLFEQQNGNAPASKEQGQDCPGWSAANNAAGCLFELFRPVRLCCLSLCSFLILHDVPPHIERVSGDLAACGQGAQQDHEEREDEQRAQLPGYTTDASAFEHHAPQGIISIGQG